MKSINYFFLTFFLALLSVSLFYRCAHIMSPTGGPKDTIPPHLVTSKPADQTLNYHGQHFTYTFDEKIKIKDIKTQLIITPRIDFKYDYKYKKQTLTLSFDSTFQDSTTYTFNFREAIQDLTEGNVTKDNKFVFSTGGKLDSLSLEGYVTSLLKVDSLKEITVGLFNAHDTVTIFNGSPYYFTETDEDGHYSLDNLKNGEYLLYAFKDSNKNLKLETNNEMYGFVRDTILLDSNINQLNIPVFNLDLRPLKLQTALPSGQYFDINYNKYITNYQIHPLKDSLKLYSNFVKDHKSIRIYNTFPDKDSIGIYVKAYDSLNYALVDTVYAKYKESTRKKETLSVSVTPTNSTGIDAQYIGTVDFNKPIIKINPDSIFIQFDTTKVATFYADTSLTFNAIHTKATIQTVINKAEADSVLARRQRRDKSKLDSAKTAMQSKEKLQNVKQQIGKAKAQQHVLNKGLQLYLGNGAFISVDGDTSIQSGVSYKFIDPVEYGTIRGTIHTDYKHYTVQLLNSSYEIVQSLDSPTQYEFPNIPVGSYRIRVLIDNNNDGIWSKGNMIIREGPEKVYFFPKLISIRANWQLNQDLTF